MYASQRPLNNLRPPLFYSQNEQQKKAESGDAAMPSLESRQLKASLLAKRASAG